MQITLYRPVNKDELMLIEQSNWKAFPPRLPGQPIFYPVLNQAYASQITKEWNIPTYGNGYVVKFDISEQYFKRFDVHTVGLPHHQELWVSAEEMEEFNSQIIGTIEVVEQY